MKVIPKLNLNMSPQTAEENSLVFARNMKIDNDGNLVNDFGYKTIDAELGFDTNTIHHVGTIVGINNDVFLFYAERRQTQAGVFYINEHIVRYNEVSKTFEEVDTAWNYNGGTISGLVTTNVTGEEILTIAEGNIPDRINVPLKHINLSHCSSEDDESIYSQAPLVPICNLKIINTYVKTIPNGTYVFFIRYKIRKDVYTGWYLCSRPIFGGTSERTETIQGGLEYINIHKDSAKSFIFKPSFLVNPDDPDTFLNIDLYEEFQLGFIITHDEATDARIWKSFKFADYGEDFNIYFDYEDVKEANIDDFLKPTYEINNVNNITNYKNKLYISNYLENNFNEDLTNLANNIELGVTVEENTDYDAVNQLTIKYPLAQRVTIDYDYNQKQYSTLIPGTASSYYDITTDMFNFKISKLIKNDSAEKDEICSFEVKWIDTTSDPELASVYNIKSKIKGDSIFGKDGSLPEYHKDTGLNLVGSSGTLVYYSRPVSHADYHPWYDLGLTFAYGALPFVGVNIELAKGRVYPIKQGTNIIIYNSNNCWVTSNNTGFNNPERNIIEDYIRSEIKSKSLFRLNHIEVYDGAKTYYLSIGSESPTDLNYFESDSYVSTNLTFDISDFNTKVLSPDTIGKIKNLIKSKLFNYIKGFDEYGTPIIRTTIYDPSSESNNQTNPHLFTKTFKCKSIELVFDKYDFEVGTIDTVSDTETVYDKIFNITLKTTKYNAACNFDINDFININNYVEFTQQSSLMRFSTYQPYIHFVNRNHIIQNGIKYNDLIEVGDIDNQTDLIKLTYSVSENIANNKYAGFFVTLENVGDIIVEGFDYIYNAEKDIYILQVLEVDCLLYNLNDNITICIPTNNGYEVLTRKAKYYSSGSYETSLSFGNCGFISWKTSDLEEGQEQYQYSASDKIFIRIERSVNDSKINHKLVKATEYIPLIPTLDDEDEQIFVTVDDGFYNSYACVVRKPDFALSSSCYVSGNDVYEADRNTDLTLSEFKGYIQTQGSISYFIRSNFNLNYLSLTEDINDKIFSVGSAGSGVKQVAKVLNSLILNNIYELKSMYKDFANKYFSERDSDYIIKFNNTIRVSNVLSDETFNNSIFTFEPTNYYNIPSDRGEIVKLFSIGNIIYAHTIHSLYKFDAKQTIVTTDSDIQLQEAEPFEVGLSQVLDSEFGYGGISNKDAGCVTFNSYFFYDQLSNHIFSYGGNGQISLIDENIFKILDYYKPNYCRTLHDDKNNRVLFEFTSSREEAVDPDFNTFVLSYNYKYKSFVSFHDLNLKKTFSTRSNVYSCIKDKPFSLFNDYIIENINIDTTFLNEDMNVRKIFGNATAVCMVEFGNNKYKKQSSPFNIAIICLPKQSIRENVNNISYIADIQRKGIIQENEDTVYDLITSPNIDRDNPVSRFYIITDSCVSSKINTTIDDTVRPNTLNDYEGFKYDKGIWTGNYFRNIINNENTYDYPDSGYSGLSNDNDSLVYGRYFILVFDFLYDTPIKFEEIFVNTNIY